MGTLPAKVYSTDVDITSWDAKNFWELEIPWSCAALLMKGLVLWLNKMRHCQDLSNCSLSQGFLLSSRIVEPVGCHRDIGSFLPDRRGEAAVFATSNLLLGLNDLTYFRRKSMPVENLTSGKTDSEK